MDAIARSKGILGSTRAAAQSGLSAILPPGGSIWIVTTVFSDLDKPGPGNPAAAAPVLSEL